MGRDSSRVRIGNKAIVSCPSGQQILWSYWKSPGWKSKRRCRDVFVKESCEGVVIKLKPGVISLIKIASTSMRRRMNRASLPATSNAARVTSIQTKPNTRVAFQKFPELEITHTCVTSLTDPSWTHHSPHHEVKRWLLYVVGAPALFFRIATP